MRALTKWTSALTVLAIVGTLGGIQQAKAAGFQIGEQNIRANGMGGAYTAIAADPSAIHFNPAGLGFLRGIQLTTGVTFIKGRNRYEGFSGNDTENRERYIGVPYGFGSLEINDMITVGGGVHAPYGLELIFPRQAETRYSNTRAFIRGQHFSVAVGIRPTDWISIGLGLSYINTRRVIPGQSKEGLRVQRAVDLSESIFNSLRAQLPASVPNSAVRAQARSIASTVPEPLSRLKGDVDGFGYTLGLLLKPMKEFSFGITYKGEANLRGSGDGDFAGVVDPAGLPAGSLTNVLIRNHIRTSLVLPPSLSVAVASQLNDKFTATAQVDWTGWSTIDEVNIRFVTGRPVTVQSLELKWRDTVAIRLGAEYLMIGKYSEINKSVFKPNKKDSEGSDNKDVEEEKTEGGYAVALRLGYIWDESPVPTHTQTAFLPDNDRHAFNIGVGFDTGRFRVDASFQYFYFKTSTRDNPTEGVDNELHPTQGRFKVDAILIGLGITTRF